MKPQRVVKREYEKSVKRIAGKYERVAGWIGLDANTIETGIPDLIYVRMVNGQAVKAINRLAPLVYNYPVEIARNESSAYWEVVALRQPYSVPLQQVKSHHSQHEYPASDTVWVRDAQFMPLLVLPASGLTVAIYGGVVRAGGQYYAIENQTLDLTASVPATGAKWALIEVVAGVVTVTLSAEYAGYTELLPSNIPLGSGYALCAIRLYAGQSQISRDGSNNDFVDLRFTKADAVLTLGELGDVDIVTPSDGDVLTYDSYTSLWVNAAIPAGVSTLDDLTDVDVPTPSDGDVLTYDSYTSLWVASAPAGGSVWGSITGTLSDQTDLNSALNARLVAASNLSDLANAGTARTNLGLVAGGAGDIWVEKAGDTMTGQLLVDLGSDVIGLRIQGDASQTANLQTWENSGGTVLAGIGKGGRFFANLGTDSTNLFIGAGAGNTPATGATYNLALGSSALAAITSGDYNTAIGTDALIVLTEGSQNVAIGWRTLSTITTASSNMAIGSQALRYNGTGNSNVAIGTSAMIGGAGRNQSETVAIGSKANYYGGSSNTCIGFASGYNLSGYENVAIGHIAGYGSGGATDSRYNVFIGKGAGYTVNGSSYYSTIIGFQAGYNMGTAAGYNVFIGANAGYRQTTPYAKFIVYGGGAALGSATLEQERSFLFGNMAAGGYLQLNIGTTTANAPKDTFKLQAFVSSASTGASNGFGVGLPFYAETATDETYQQQARITSAWVDATNASRKAKLSLYAYDTAARLGLEIEADGSAAKIGLFGVTPVVRPTALTTQLTTITHTAPGTPNYAIQDLIDSSAGAAFGFATKDEGNTVLSVIANLQTRVSELETKLQALGALT